MRASFVTRAVVKPKSATHYALVFPGTPRFHSSHSRSVAVKG
jgi:hypothetical protein